MPSQPLAAIIWANASRLIGLPPGEVATVRDMKNRTGLPIGNLQRLHGGGNPTMNTVLELARALHVDVHVLMRPNAGADLQALEPAGRYVAQTNEALIESLAELARRVPAEARPAFADVVSGWIASGGEVSRATALLALLQLDTKRQHAA